MIAYDINVFGYASYLSHKLYLKRIAVPDQLIQAACCYTIKKRCHILEKWFRSNAVDFSPKYPQQTRAVLCLLPVHYDDVIMGAIASLITSLTIVYSTVYSDADQRKHQSSASLAIVWGIHRGPVNSPHKWPVTRKMLPFHDVIMQIYVLSQSMCTVVLYLPPPMLRFCNHGFLWGFLQISD